MMFTEIELKNYMSLKNIKLDMKQKNDAKSIVAIYGENGSGKSNVVSAFMNLSLSINTLKSQKIFNKMESNILSDDENDNNMSDDAKKMKLDAIRSIQNSQYTSLLRIFQNTYLFGEHGPTELKFNFKIDGHAGYYKLVFEKSNGKAYLATEELNYVIKKSSGMIYIITGDKDGNISYKLSPQLLKNKELFASIDDSIYRLWGKHSFLSIFNEFQNENNNKYIEDNVLASFLTVISDFRQISFKTDGASGMSQFPKLLPDLYRGTIDYDGSEERIIRTMAALDKYFVPLYSDIVELSYKSIRVDDNMIRYELYEKKRISNKIVEIPFALESNGTKRLLDLFPLFLNAVNGNTVIIDEIDQGIHDLLIDRIIDNIKEDITGQLIFTTHDTQVMKQLDVSSLYVIQVDSEGNKRIVNISKASKGKIAANNNVQKLYLDGYFAGIPYSDDVDFYDILEGIGVNNDK